jgi:hypothetical protein
MGGNGTQDSPTLIDFSAAHDVLDRLGIPGGRGSLSWRMGYLEGYVGRLKAFDEHQLDAAEEARCWALMNQE